MWCFYLVDVAGVSNDQAVDRAGHRQRYGKSGWTGVPVGGSGPGSELSAGVGGVAVLRGGRGGCGGGHVLPGGDAGTALE